MKIEIMITKATNVIKTVEFLEVKCEFSMKKNVGFVWRLEDRSGYSVGDVKLKF